MSSFAALMDHVIAVRAEVARMRQELGISEEEAEGRTKAAIAIAVDQLYVPYQQQASASLGTGSQQQRDTCFATS